MFQTAFKVVFLSFLATIFAFSEGELEGEAKSFVGISGSTIISNAKTWLNPCVPYSTSSYHIGVDGIKYRQDCSGYVSMAWQLGSSQTTSTLASYSTKISKSDLQSGDILLNAGDHVLIFDKWADSGKTKYYAYEQHPDCTEYHSITYPYWSNYDPQDYYPYRYNKVTTVTNSTVSSL
jgi:hypothetical protein